MSDINNKSYSLEGRSRNVTSMKHEVLPGNNIFSRKLIGVELINHFDRPNDFAGIHIELIYQKRGRKSDQWPNKHLDLRDADLKGKSFRLTLDTEQSKKIFDLIDDAYLIAKDGIKEGSRLVLRNVEPEQIVITDKNRAGIFEKILNSSNQDGLLELLKQGLPSELIKKLAIHKIYEDRLKIIEEFENNISKERGEEFWQQFFKKNKWIFGTFSVEIIDERRIDIHHGSDFPLAVDGGFMDIAEIKKPELPFWLKKKDGNNFLYRSKFLIPSYDLQGAISQCIKYIYQAEKKVDSQEYKKDHSGIIPLKPKGMIIHGRSNDWHLEEWEAFRLLNDEHHGIEILTFDLLLDRAKRALNLFKNEKK